MLITIPTRPELDSITIRGFKSIASIEELPLRPINLVVGPNGSGKSNFIGVFSFLHAIREGHLHDYVIKAGGADRVLHFGSKVTPNLEIHISFQGGKNQYQIVLGATEDDQLYPQSERAYFWDKANYPRPIFNSLRAKGVEAGISDPKQGSRIGSYVRRHLDRWRLYHFHDTSASSPMKSTADVDDNDYLRPDGSNLAAFLYFLSEKHAESYSLIRRAVQRVAPFFDDFHLRPQKLNPGKIRLEWRHKGTEAYFAASSLSDGTLRFIGLATLFLQPQSLRPSVILVDEPELGLQCLASCMVDYYALPQTDERGWPGWKEAGSLLFPQKAPTIQEALVTDICNVMGRSFDSRRFLPYVMMHEFEALLFSDCERFAQGIGRPDLSPRFQQIRNASETPEEIDDSPSTAPSKRVQALVPGYEKPLMGTLAILEIGLTAIRSQCPHFRSWLERLETSYRGAL